MPIKDFTEFKISNEFNVKIPMISRVKTHILASIKLCLGIVDRNTLKPKGSRNIRKNLKVVTKSLEIHCVCDTVLLDICV